MMARKDKVVKRAHAGRRRPVQEAQDRLGCAGTARARRAPDRVVRDRRRRARRSQAARILIATGSAPIALPGLPFDGERIVSSTEALALPRGARSGCSSSARGAIGLELGSVWPRLGAEVTVVEFLDRIVPGMDRADGRACCSASLEKQGLTLPAADARRRGAERDGDGVRVTLESERRATPRIDATSCWSPSAAGRTPTGSALARSASRSTSAAASSVDEHFATSVPGIYAIGDVIAGPDAGAQGRGGGRRRRRAAWPATPGT